MSGLCGICEPGREMPREMIGSMLSALASPDETERESSGGKSAAMGVSRRWTGQQIAHIPGVRIAVDLDLYSVAELTAFLQRQGIGAEMMSSAEQIAWLYVKMGLDFLQHLDGAFCIALWDEKNERLVLAIDRLGIKSLYWARERSTLFFASRVGAIRSVSQNPPEINSAALMQFLLFSVVPAPMSIYHNVSKMRPGTLICYDKGQVREQQYWDLHYSEGQNRDKSYWAEQVREGMRAAVRRNLEGCIPAQTGAYLSGGTDSSSVVAFMNERHSPVNTFSIFFQEAKYSEIGFARTTAECFKTKHHERSLTPQDAYDAIPKITQFYDEPFANSSAVGAYYCAVMARENGCDTLLAGDGGDELFAGNERYVTDKYFSLYHRIPVWMRKRLIEPAADLLPENDGRLSLPRRYIRRAQIPSPQRVISYNFFLSNKADEIFEPAFLDQVPQETWLNVIEAHTQRSHANNDLNRHLYLDVKLTLADNDLRKVSGTAELAGVRVRYPLLDYKLAELSARIPSSLKLRGFKKRYIFKKAMQDILPAAILTKKKHGFGVPLSSWFLHDSRLNALVRDVLLDSRTRQRGYFRREFVDRLLGTHQREQVSYYGEIVWYLLALELWHRQHLEIPQNVSYGA